MTDFIALSSAFLSLLATAAAAIAAWRMPKAAALLAESLRREGDITSEKYKNKLQVFSALMQERAAVYSENGVKNLNLVDVIFNDVPPVREAWAELYKAFEHRPPPPDYVYNERLQKLLAAMALDLKLADKLRIDDLARVYHPTAMAQDKIIKDVQRQNLWLSLQSSPPAANVQQPPNPFPPKPE